MRLGILSAIGLLVVIASAANHQLPVEIWSAVKGTAQQINPPVAIKQAIASARKAPVRSSINAEAFVQNYFASLNRHDIKAAKRSLDPKLDRKWSDGYEQYWQQFERGSLTVTVLAIATDAQGFSKVKFLRRGKFNGVTVESRWIYVLADRGSDFRIISISLSK